MTFVIDLNHKNHLRKEKDANDLSDHEIENTELAAEESSNKELQLNAIFVKERKGNTSKRFWKN